MKTITQLSGVLPGIGVALLPRLLWPSCLPAYAGFASSVGLGFLINNTIMLRITIIALLLSVVSLAYKAKRRRGYLPFWTGLGASFFIVGGKYLFDIQLLFYSGIILLIAASLWNSWPMKKHAELQTKIA